MPTSDDELQQKRTHIEDLREELRQAEANRDEKAREWQNDHDLALLEIEEAKLKARISEVESQAEAETKAGEASAEKVKASQEASTATTVDPTTGLATAPGDGPGFQAQWDKQQEELAAAEAERDMSFDSSSPVPGVNQSLTTDDNEGR